MFCVSNRKFLKFFLDSGNFLKSDFPSFQFKFVTWIRKIISKFGGMISGWILFLRFAVW